MTIIYHISEETAMHQDRMSINEMLQPYYQRSGRAILPDGSHPPYTEWEKQTSDFIDNHCILPAPPACIPTIV